MNELNGKTPFFRLLLPVIGAIISSPFLSDIGLLAVILILSGALLFFLSFIRYKQNHYSQRWLFGAGTYLFLFGLTLLQCGEMRAFNSFTFPEHPNTYLAVILDIPEEKERSVQCPVLTAPPLKKKVMLYLEKSNRTTKLLPGDEIIFIAQPEPFRNFGNPGEWDYAGYMRNKGFAARDYITDSEWRVTGRRSNTPYLLAQKCRIYILNYYRSLGLEGDTYAFIAAITLGYKAYLSDDIRKAFQASGTAHLLAVSGLHTGIIYLIITLILSPLGTRGRGFLIRQLTIILMLWGYAFLAGLSASVVRAVIMLSLYCLGKMRREKSFTLNTLAAAAFLILIFHPNSFYDISFQMSFSAVFSILWFQPRITSLVIPKNWVTRYLWNLMTLSLSAQLGLFPLLLYYFGTFPTWFFITNILVVPLMGIIIYSLIPLLLTGWLPEALSSFPEWLPQILRRLVQLLTDLMLHIVQFMESLPFAQLTGLNISLPAAILLLIFIFLISHFMKIKRPLVLTFALSSLLSFQLLSLWEQLQSTSPQLVVINNSPQSEISLYVDETYHPIWIPENGVLPHPHKKIIRLSDGSFNDFTTNTTFPVDILILSRHCCFDAEQLFHIFHPSLIVLDSSLPRYSVISLKESCLNRGIPVHDVRQDGAYSLNF